MELEKVKAILRLVWRAKMGNLLQKAPIITLVGTMGIGKSDIVSEFFRDLEDTEGANYFHEIYLAQVEVGDLIGIPGTNEGKTVYNKPDWWPNEYDKGILFFDELGDAKDDVRKAIMPLLQSGRLHGSILPPGIQIVCAMNPIGLEYGGYDFTEQFKNRLAFLRVIPPVSEYMDYLEREKTPIKFRNMIAEQPDLLHDQQELRKDDASWAKGTEYVGRPTRRSMYTAIKYLQFMSDEDKVFIGPDFLVALVGEAAAASLLTYDRRQDNELIRPEDIYDKEKQPEMLAMVRSWHENGRLEKLSAFTRLITSFIKNNPPKKEQFKLIESMVDALPEDMSVGVLEFIKTHVKSGSMILLSMSNIVPRIRKIISGEIVFKNEELSWKENN